MPETRATVLRHLVLCLGVLLLCSGCDSKDPKPAPEGEWGEGFDLSSETVCGTPGASGTVTEEVLTTRSYSAVRLAWGAHPSDVWAVRGGYFPLDTPLPGTGLFRWNGTQWTLQQLQEPLQELRIITGSSPEDVWFAGWRGGLLYHWNGTALEKVPSGASFAITDLQVLDATTAWAVAPGGDSLKKSQLLRWDGTTWSVAAELPDNVEYLWAAGREELWLRSPSAVYRWHEGQFTIMMGGQTSAKRGIWGSAPHDIWVARTSDLMHWNGSTLEAVPGSPERVTQLWGTGPQDVWFLSGTYNRALHWDGSQFVTSAPVSCLYSCNWTSLQGTRPDDVWATGAHEVMHWDGKAWSIVEQGEDLNEAYDGPGPGLWRVGPSDLWTFEPSFHQVNHWDGQRLTAIPGTGAERVVRRNLEDVWALSPTDVWAVGAGGTAVHYDGRSWSPVPTGTSVDLLSVSGSAADDVWAVGRQGTVLHWDGQAWSRLEAGTRADLTGVFAGAGGDFVVAVGQEGTLLQRRKTGLWLTHTGAHGDLSGVWARGPNDVWALNTAGTIFHWQGASVSEVATGRSGHRDIWGGGSQGLIAAGGWFLDEPWQSVAGSGSPQDAWVSPKGVVWLTMRHQRPLLRREYVTRYTHENCWRGGEGILSFGFPSLPIRLSAMHGAGEHDVWFVGNYGRIFHLQLPAEP